MKRFSKRYDNRRKKALWISLNDYEYEMLGLKSEKCNMSRSAYVRELICGCCPTEAPPERFYEIYEEVNKLMNGIMRLKDEAVAESYMSAEDVKRLICLVYEIRNILVDMKKEVVQAKPYDNSYFETLIQQKEGGIVGLYKTMAYIWQPKQ